MKAKNARDYTIQLQEAVAGRSVTFTQTYFKRYAGEFKRALDVDKMPRPLLENAIAYIAEFWDTQQLSVQKAVSGVQSRRAVSQTSEDRIREYEEIFELSPRQKAMERLIEAKGHLAVLAWVREKPEELQEYLEEKIKGTEVTHLGQEA